jgi:hypothetical protein
MAVQGFYREFLANIVLVYFYEDSGWRGMFGVDTGKHGFGGVSLVD